MHGFAILVLNRSRDFVDFFRDLNRNINLKPEVIYRSVLIPGNVATILHISSLFNIGFSWTLTYNSILVTKPKNITILCLIFANRLFARSGHMVRNKLHWDASYAVGLPKQRNSYQSSPTFLCFESPSAKFASQYNLFRAM